MLTSYGKDTTVPKDIDGVTYYTADEVYMDQAAVDKVVADRLARDRKDRPAHDDYDQIKGERDDLAKRLADAEKAHGAALEAARKEAGDEARTETAKTYAERVLAAEVRAAATAKGFHDPADVLTQLGDIAELWGEDGSLDVESLTERVDGIAAAKPYLLSTPAPTPEAGQAGIGSGPEAGIDAEPGADRLSAYYSSAKN